MDVFRGSITRYREAVQQLFGYRMDMTAEATASAKDAASAPVTVSLRPAAAGGPGEGALLMFRLSSGRGMELLPTPYSETMRTEARAASRRLLRACRARCKRCCARCAAAAAANALRRPTLLLCTHVCTNDAGGHLPHQVPLLPRLHRQPDDGAVPAADAVLRPAGVKF
jgi:hypothetical protein